MKLPRIHTTRRELTIVAAIWVVLFGAGAIAVVSLQSHAHQIVYHLEYVAIPRYGKALALYAEAEKRGLAVLKKRQQLNADATTATAVASNDPDYLASDELFRKAFAMDPREPFIGEQERYYTVWGDVLGAVGEVQRQLTQYARAALARKDIRGAEDLVGRALAAGNNPDAHLVAAQLAYRTDRKSSASAELALMGPVDKRSYDAHLLQGQIYMEQGKPDLAVTEYDLALKSTDLQMDTRKRLYTAYRVGGNLNKAIEVLQEGLTKGGNGDGNYMHVLGDALRDAGRNRDALPVLEEAAKLEPNSGAVSYSLAKAYEAVGDKRRSVRALNRALALDPGLQKLIMK